jgi:hypothetical protein
MSSALSTRHRSFTLGQLLLRTRMAVSSTAHSSFATLSADSLLRMSTSKPTSTSTSQSGDPKTQSHSQNSLVSAGDTCSRTSELSMIAHSPPCE